MKRRKKDEISQPDREFLRTLANMFYAMEQCYKGLSNKTGVDEDCIRFQGFDEHSDYERKLSDHYLGGFDSHRPTVPLYRVLVSRWEQSKDKEHLTKDDLIRICMPPFFE